MALDYCQISFRIVFTLNILRTNLMEFDQILYVHWYWQDLGADQHAPPCSLTRALVIHLLESITSKLDTSKISIF